MASRDLKDRIERTLRDVKSDFERNETLRHMKPAVVVVLGLLVCLWIVSGGPAVLFGAASFTLLFVIAALVFFLPPFWVYYDANRREVKHPLAWSIFALFAPVLGALVYYLIRPDAPQRRDCEGCGREISAGFGLCPFCGTSQVSVQDRCPSCHANVEAEWQFCPYCRLSLRDIRRNPAAEDSLA